jgi:hypothetical protein
VVEVLQQVFPALRDADRRMAAFLGILDLVFEFMDAREQMGVFRFQLREACGKLRVLTCAE